MKTAVEQLEKRLKKCIAKQNPNDIIVLQLTKFTFERWFEQAKEMEKEQQYYNETFKQQEQ
jgi:hypothetical protein